MFSLKRLKNHDYIITISCGLLSILSLVLIYSSTFNAQTLEAGAGTFKKQIIFFIAGFIIYIVLSTFDIAWIQNLKILAVLFLITIFLLIYVKFFTGEIASTNRWITFFGFSFQPAEYAKITLTIITAAIFSHKETKLASLVEWNKKISAKKFPRLAKILTLFAKRFPTLPRFLISFSLALIIVFLVFAQPAFGNSVIILILWMSIIFAYANNQLKILNFSLPLVIIPLVQWKVINLEFLPDNSEIILFLMLFLISLIASVKTKLKWYLVILSLFLALSVKPITLSLWETDFLSTYQKDRIETFFGDPEENPLDAGYQVRQSKIAIGAGRLFGRGYLQGTQSTLKVLPFAHTDFIFASLAEQFGLIGSSLLISIYVVLLIRILQTASKSKDEFSFLLTVGFCMMLLLNIFINIGMNLGKLPVTGVPLPLISYGGSSVIVNLAGLGLVQATRKRISIKDISETLTPSNSPWA